MNKMRINVVPLLTIALTVTQCLASGGYSHSGNVVVSGKPANNEQRVAQSSTPNGLFDYQGYLTNSGSPATGNYDFEFTVYDAQTAGNQLGSPMDVAGVAVSNGYFLVPLDLSSIYTGNLQWIAVGWRPSGSSNPYTSLGDRQPLTPTPPDLYSEGGYSIVGVTNVDLSPSQVLVSSANNEVTTSGITTGELENLHGTTAAIQPQLDSKIFAAGGSATNLSVTNLTLTNTMVMAPSNGLQFQTPGTPITLSSASLMFNGVRDDLAVWGHNVVPGTVDSRFDPNKPIFRQMMESDYSFDGVNHLMEWNIDYISADNSAWRRFLGLVIDRSTNEGKWFFRTGPNSELSLYMANGKAGIGTSLLGESFTINGGSQANGMGVYYDSYTWGNIRGVIRHAGNKGGYNSLGGLQIAAQGTTQSTAGSGSINFFTPTGNSANTATDAPLALRMTINNSGSVGIGTTFPNPSSVLELVSTTQAFILPRMTKAQRNAIPHPVAGMEVFQTDQNPGKRVFNGTNWVRYAETVD